MTFPRFDGEPAPRGFPRQAHYEGPMPVWRTGSGVFACVSRSGVRRRRHCYDKDGRCLFCTRRKEKF